MSASSNPVRITQRRRIPDEIMQAVVVVYGPHPTDGVPVPAGTAFLFRYPSRVKAGSSYSLMATARHVVTNERGAILPSLQIRANLRGGDSAFLDVPAEIFLHSDATVDLCVMAGRLDRAVFEYRELTPEFFPPPEALKPPLLGAGIDVSFIGLFQPHPGASRNQPIARFGRIAMVPTERVFWTETDHELLLVEASAYGGNSGAPVFAFLEGYDGARLLGVLKGSFREAAVQVENISLRAVDGISAVTPAYLLEEFVRDHVVPELDRRMS